MRKAHWSLLFALALASASPAAAEPPAAEPPAAEPPHGTDLQALKTGSVVIDDADPERSVPDRAWALGRPMEMGYLVMVLAERAEAATKKGDHLAAARYYRAIGKAVPDRAVAFAKACRAYETAGMFAQAVESCREALGMPGVTVDDHLRYVRTSLRLPGALSAEHVSDLDAVLTRLQKDVPNVESQEAIAYLRCDFGLRIEQPSHLQQCISTLQALGVSSPRLLGYEWSLAMLRGDAEKASALIERARTAGLPAGAIKTMEARFEQEHPSAVPYARTSIGLALGLVLTVVAVAIVMAGLFARQRAFVRSRAGL